MLLDKTGYPLALGMKDVQGRKMCRTGSAAQRVRLLGDGSGLVKSRAAGGRMDHASRLVSLAC